MIVETNNNNAMIQRSFGGLKDFCSTAGSSAALPEFIDLTRLYRELQGVPLAGCRHFLSVASRNGDAVPGVDVHVYGCLGEAVAMGKVRQRLGVDRVHTSDQAASGLLD